MNYEFTKLGAVEALTEMPENANALVEVDGAIKRVPASAAGGGSASGGNAGLDAWDFVLEAQGDTYEPVEPTVTPWHFAKGTFSDMWGINKSGIIPRVCVYYCYVVDGKQGHAWYYPSLINYMNDQIDIYIDEPGIGGTVITYSVSLFDNGDIVVGKIS